MKGLLTKDGTVTEAKLAHDSRTIQMQNSLLHSFIVSLHMLGTENKMRECIYEYLTVVRRHVGSKGKDTNKSEQEVSDASISS